MHKAIVFTDLSFQYKGADRPALDRVSWSLNRGECAVIMGASTSGKTTLCRCINGLIPQALEGRISGKIRVAGKDVSRFRVQTMAKEVGFVMQDPETQIVGRTVFEDLAFGPRNFMVPAPEIEKRIPEALARMNLEGYEHRSTAELSGGEKQRLTIAGILAMAPSILVLDEPASEMDPQGRARLYAHLDRLKKSTGLTLVIVEQKPEDILPMVDQAIFLDQGRITYQGPLQQIPRACRFDENVIPPDPTRPPCPEDAPILLEVSGLDFQYTRSVPVLKGVSLKVRQNDFLAIMGPNGAGKTTLVKHLNGLIPCQSGTIQFCGQDLSRMTVKERARSVGFVFQNPDHQIFENSVEKEIAFGLANQGLPKQEVARQVDETLSETGLAPFRKHHPFILGKGMRQMIAVASIAALKPRVLVVDEPTTGLDPAGSVRIMNLIQRLHNRGTAIVLITHDIAIAARYARRLVVMEQGRIIREHKLPDNPETRASSKDQGPDPDGKSGRLG